MSCLCVLFEGIAEESGNRDEAHGDYEWAQQQQHRHDNASNHVLDGSQREFIVATFENKIDLVYGQEISHWISLELLVQESFPCLAMGAGRFESWAYVIHGLFHRFC
jgi:hypothetical protein